MTLDPIHLRAAFDNGFAPLEVLCPRCVKGAPGPADDLCHACRGEVAANRDDARDEFVATLHTGHGINHHAYRADVRFPGNGAA